LIRLFSEFGRCRRYLKSKKINKQLSYFLSGCYSGLVCLILICPIEHLKCRQQLEVNKHLSPSQIACMIVNREGYFGIFRGFWATFNRDFLSYGVYFWTYYSLRDICMEKYKCFNSTMQLLAGGMSGSK
jgi:hypothetical protein